MPDLNEMRRYMDFYDQQGLGNPTYTSNYSNGVSANGAVPIHDDNRANTRMMWAMSMLGGGQNGGEHRMPDYFNTGGQPNGGSYSPSAYQEPQQFQPQQPMQQRPMNNLGQNYLAQLLQKGPR